MKKNRISSPIGLKVLLAIVFSICFVSLSGYAEQIMVLKGSSVNIPVPEGIKKIIVASPGIIDARPSDDGSSVLVSGLAVGTSEVRIQKLQGADLVESVVVSDNLNETLTEIKELLSDVDGLEIKILGNKILFKGNILTKSDYEKVSRVVSAYPSAILNMTKFDSSEMNKYYVEAILKDIGVDTVTARVMGDTVVLEGIVYSEAEKARAEEMAKLRMPNVKNLLTVQDVMIETDVQFISVDMSKGKNMGMNVLDTLSASATGSGSSVGGGFANLPISFGVTGSASFVADLLNSNGKTVASPHLSTKNGETGNFQSGGTAYLNAPGAQGVGNLIPVDYGVILKVKPTLKGHDSVQNDVTVEVSMPTGVSGAQFAVQKYSTACTSVCKIGESMVLSGMTQTISSGTSSKTPFLGDVPLLELFFSNKSSDKQRHEFVIVVTPQPVFPSAATGSPFGEQHKELLQDKDKPSKE